MSFLIIDHMARRERGSRPVVGSSKKITGGVAIRLTAKSRRRRIPPEYVLAGLSAAFVIRILLGVLLHDFCTLFSKPVESPHHYKVFTTG